MTVVAAVLVPVVLLYQAWTYHVFRARLGGEEAGAPVDLVARKTRLAARARDRSAPPAPRAGGARHCSPPTRRSASLAALLVLAQAVLLARVAARALRRRDARRGRPGRSRCSPRSSPRARRRRGPSRSSGGARRRACSRSSGSSSSSGRLRDRPAALDGAESAEVATAAVAGVDALETTFARYLPQVVLAARRAGRRDRLRRLDRPRLGRRSCS